MKKPTVVKVDRVMPFSPPEFEEAFASKMLIDMHNSGSDKLQINHCVLKAGCSLPGATHRTPYDEIYYVLSGIAVLRMDAADYDLEKDTIVFIPGGTFHALTNKSSSEDFVILTIWPGQPEPGVNEVYDLRKKAWGGTYREIDDMPSGEQE
jgi:mannose-6-phosphate isomerase-like protein (cupin superfamily)